MLCMKRIRKIALRVLVFNVFIGRWLIPDHGVHFRFFIDFVWTLVTLVFQMYYGARYLRIMGGYFMGDWTSRRLAVNITLSVRMLLDLIICLISIWTSSSSFTCIAELLFLTWRLSDIYRARQYVNAYFALLHELHQLQQQNQALQQLLAHNMATAG